MSVCVRLSVCLFVRLLFCVLVCCACLSNRVIECARVCVRLLVRLPGWSVGYLVGCSLACLIACLFVGLCVCVLVCVVACWCVRVLFVC